MAGYGLRLARQQGMEGFSGNLAEFAINPSNTNPIFHGDVVRLSSGYVIEGTGAADDDDLDILGVFNGCKYVDSDGSFEFQKFWDGGAGRTNIRADIILPVNGVFHIKGKAGVTYTQAAVGARFGLTYVAGSTVYGDSKVSLGAAAAALTGPLIVHGVAGLPNNLIGGAEPVFEVGIIRQQLTAAGLGVGFGS